MVASLSSRWDLSVDNRAGQLALVVDAKLAHRLNGPQASEAIFLPTALSQKRPTS
jgi:hypothetical protein